MAVPKRRKSKSRTNIRWAHAAQIPVVNPIPCPKCGELTLPHQACSHCGQYRGRVVREVEET